MFKIFEMSVIFKMAAKIRHKIWAVKIQHCPISSKFDMMSWIDSRHWTISTGRHFQNGHHNTHKFNIVRFQRHFICGWIMMSRIESRHWTIYTGRHFQNGHHNTPNIQHCPISSRFDMWVDNDVLNWFLTLKNFYRSPFSKWPPQYRKNSTLSDIIKIWYIGR